MARASVGMPATRSASDGPTAIGSATGDVPAQGVGARTATKDYAKGDLPGQRNCRWSPSVHEEYETLEVLGQGTYGVVYKARHRKTGRLVGLKRCRLDALREFGIPETTLREVCLLRDLRHPNIMRLYHISCNTERLYMVCEYLDLDLKKYIRAHPKGIPLRKIKDITYALFSGLAYCHGHRIIHRDLKPHNILVGNDATEVKIADFGLARTALPPGKTLTHEVITLWYRAPELLLGHCNYTTGVDIWSAGCIVAELLNGRPLYVGDSEIDTLFKIFRLLGTPPLPLWPQHAAVPWDQFPKLQGVPDPFGHFSTPLDASGKDFLKRIFQFNPDCRLRAPDALQHPWLQEVREAQNAATSTAVSISSPPLASETCADSRSHIVQGHLSTTASDVGPPAGYSDAVSSRGGPQTLAADRRGTAGAPPPGAIPTERRLSQRPFVATGPSEPSVSCPMVKRHVTANTAALRELFDPRVKKRFSGEVNAAPLPATTSNPFLPESFSTACTTQEVDDNEGQSAETQSEAPPPALPSLPPSQQSHHLFHHNSGALLSTLQSRPAATMTTTTTTQGLLYNEGYTMGLDTGPLATGRGLPTAAPVFYPPAEDAKRGISKTRQGWELALHPSSSSTSSSSFPGMEDRAGVLKPIAPTGLARPLERNVLEPHAAALEEAHQQQPTYCYYGRPFGDSASAENTLESAFSVVLPNVQEQFNSSLQNADPTTERHSCPLGKVEKDEEFQQIQEGKPPPAVTNFDDAYHQQHQSRRMCPSHTNEPIVHSLSNQICSRQLDHHLSRDDERSLRMPLRNEPQPCAFQSQSFSSSRASPAPSRRGSERDAGITGSSHQSRFFEPGRPPNVPRLRSGAAMSHQTAHALDCIAPEARVARTFQGSFAPYASGPLRPQELFFARRNRELETYGATATVGSRYDEPLESVPLPTLLCSQPSACATLKAWGGRPAATDPPEAAPTAHPVRNTSYNDMPVSVQHRSTTTKDSNANSSAPPEPPPVQSDNLPTTPWDVTGAGTHASLHFLLHHPAGNTLQDNLPAGLLRSILTSQEHQQLKHLGLRRRQAERRYAEAAHKLDTTAASSLESLYSHQRRFRTRLMTEYCGGGGGASRLSQPSCSTISTSSSSSSSTSLPHVPSDCRSSTLQKTAPSGGARETTVGGGETSDQEARRKRGDTLPGAPANVHAARARAASRVQNPSSSLFSNDLGFQQAALYSGQPRPPASCVTVEDFSTIHLERVPRCQRLRNVAVASERSALNVVDSYSFSGTVLRPHAGRCVHVGPGVVVGPNEKTSWENDTASVPTTQATVSSRCGVPLPLCPQPLQAATNSEKNCTTAASPTFIMKVPASPVSASVSSTLPGPSASRNAYPSEICAVSSASQPTPHSATAPPPSNPNPPPRLKCWDAPNGRHASEEKAFSAHGIQTITSGLANTYDENGDGDSNVAKRRHGVEQRFLLHYDRNDNDTNNNNQKPPSVSRRVGREDHFSSRSFL